MNLAQWRKRESRLEREEQDLIGDETIIDRLKQARDYVDGCKYRADVVQALPANAPAGYLLVTPGDSNLYIGAGAGNPLRRIPTEPF